MVCNKVQPFLFGRYNDCRQPTTEREREKEDDPHLVVAGPEVADVGELKVADFGAAFMLRAAGGRVLVSVFPAVMQKEEYGDEKEGD